MEKSLSVSPQKKPLPPGIYLVASPIGNLEDLTVRALRYLREVDVIACEDTRHSRRLLDRYEIQKPLVSLHEHNEARMSEDLLEQISRDGKRIAYLSDAGTPGISDPGERLVHRAHLKGIHCDVLPGPCAFVSAAVLAGLTSTPLFFGGFLPVKKGKRTALLLEAVSRPYTTVFYESPHRIHSTMELLLAEAPEHVIAIVREVSKTFQEVTRGTVAEVADQCLAKTPKGEFCVVISPAKHPPWLRSAFAEAAT
ncbi:MAG: 16S rRNA (cytidine(1402)-2'-O)-methyltransferase [Verrucomicrobiota bacterium]